MYDDWGSQTLLKVSHIDQPEWTGAISTFGRANKS